MKRILIISALLLMGLSFMSDMHAQNIHTSWRQKAIAVENGGESPTVIQLLKAFNKVTIPSMLDFSGESGYDADVTELLQLVTDMRTKLDRMEGLLHDISRG